MPRSRRKKPITDHLIYTLRAAVVVLSHVVIALVIIGGIFLIDMALAYGGQFTDHGGDPRIYDTIPVRYIFQTIDVGMILLFGTFAFKEAVDVFLGRDEA